MDGTRASYGLRAIVLVHSLGTNNYTIYGLLVQEPTSRACYDDLPWQPTSRASSTCYYNDLPAGLLEFWMVAPTM